MYNLFRSIGFILFFLQYATAGHAFAQAATEPATQLPEPVRIKFPKGETAITLNDHLAVGEKSKRYVLKALAGQIMRVTISPSWIHLRIVGQDGTVLESQDYHRFNFWRGKLPATQDYLIELERKSAAENEDFLLSVLINPVGQATQWFTFQEVIQQKPLNLFPNQYDSGAHDTNPNIPATYYHMLSIPFHSGGKVLRVYSACSFDSVASSDDFGSLFEDCRDGVRLAIYDPARQASTYLRAIQTVYGSNYCGIFMPFALTPDDRNIILDAWMGDPAAGGSNIDYGYTLLPVKAASKNTVYSDVVQIASRAAFFYDNYGKVVHLGDSDKMPHYPQPGPMYNYGALFFLDLITNKETIILEEENTTFNLVAIDVAAKMIILTATKYHFTDACPKDEDGYSCAEKTTTTRTISLP